MSDAALTLGEKQRLFSKLAALLILHIYDSGFEVTLGEAWRTPEQAALNAQHGIGIKHSEHCKRLAIDLNLFKDGVYLTDPLASAAHKPFGEWWQAQTTLACWGGTFSTGDANHYSLEDGGIK